MKEARDRKTNTAWYHLFVELKKVELIEAESRRVVARERGVGKMERNWSKGTKFHLYRWVSSGDLMYSMLTIVNIILLYTWNFLRVYLKCSQHTPKMVAVWSDGYVN